MMPKNSGGLESVIASESDVKQILSARDRWLTNDELKLIYGIVFQKRGPTPWDRQLQRNEPMPPEAVRDELGEDMQQTYEYLVKAQKFLSVGTRPHNLDEDLIRHLWDVTYRTNVMGSPLETRQLALMHSLIEHKARGLLEGRRCLSKVKESLGLKVADSLEDFTDWDGVLVDHLEYDVRKIGKNKTEHNREYVRRRLDGICKGAESNNVRKALRETEKLTDGVNVYDKVRAILHRGYVKRVYDAERRKLERSYEQGSAYDSAVLLVKALCFIDRLRTTETKAQVEKVTRETLDFLPFLDRMEGLLRHSGLFDKPLAFVNAALKAELLTELDQRTREAKFRRDNTFASFANLLESRLFTAEEQYGAVARRMGYGPVYVGERLGKQKA